MLIEIKAEHEFQAVEIAKDLGYNVDMSFTPYQMTDNSFAIAVFNVFISEDKRILQYADSTLELV